MHPKNVNKYMNLTLKTEKHEMNYWNYSNALWDCFGFHIAQVGNILLNQKHCLIGQLTRTGGRNNNSTLLRFYIFGFLLKYPK